MEDLKMKKTIEAENKEKYLWRSEHVRCVNDSYILTKTNLEICLIDSFLLYSSVIIDKN